MVVTVMNDIREEDLEVHETRSAKETAAVQAFMQEHALRTHGCEPPESRGIVVGVWLQGIVVGSATLDFRSGDDIFPLEDLYGSAAVALLFPEGLCRERVVQGGRWFSALPRSPVSRCVARAFAQAAQARGAYAMFSEAKPYAFKRMNEWRFEMRLNQEARANLALVPAAGLAYYETPPSPCLFRMELRSML